MDAYLAVVSKREVHEYADQPLPEAQIERILQAGRMAGSSRNTQPWLLVAVTDRARLDRLADTVRAPDNVRGCVLAVAIAMEQPGQAFDAGRVAQQMMLAAWADGIGSCPNSPADQDATRRALDLPADRHVQTVISFGYPRRERRLDPADTDRILQRAKRKPLDEVVRRL